MGWLLIGFPSAACRVPFGCSFTSIRLLHWFPSTASLVPFDFFIGFLWLPHWFPLAASLVPFSCCIGSLWLLLQFLLAVHSAVFILFGLAAVQAFVTSVQNIDIHKRIAKKLPVLILTSNFILVLKIDFRLK